MTTFFISYTSVDQKWAEWIAWQLENIGHVAIIQAWDFRPGNNFVVEMHQALKDADFTLAVCSDDYQLKVFPTAEWTSVFSKDAIGDRRRLIPIKVSPTKLDGLLGAIVYIDLFSANTEDEALNKLIDGININRAKPSSPPRFPAKHNQNRPRYPNKIDDDSSLSTERFIYQKITGNEPLSLFQIKDPYGCIADSTDAEVFDNEKAITCVLWIPHTQYLTNPSIQKHTPIVAVCVFDAAAIINGFRRSLSTEIYEKMGLPSVSKIMNEDKEKIFSAIGHALSTSFVAAVTLPDSKLSIGRSDPSIAFNHMLDILLLPLAQMHKRLGVTSFHLGLPNVGTQTTNVIASAKKMLKAIYSEKGSQTVSLGENNSSIVDFLKVARLIAWAIGAEKNQSRNSRWISFVVDAMSGEGFSRLEKPSPIDPSRLEGCD